MDFSKLGGSVNLEDLSRWWGAYTHNWKEYFFVVHEILILHFTQIVNRMMIFFLINFHPNLPGVIGVHDLHIWAMSTTETALTAHLVKPEPKDDDALIEKASKGLHDRFDIDHITLQWERCPLLNQCGDSCEIE